MINNENKIQAEANKALGNMQGTTEKTSLANVVIYEMPDRFRGNKNIDQKSKQAGLVILVLSLILIFGFVFIGWYFLSYRPSVNTQTNQAAISTATSTQATTTETQAKIQNDVLKKTYFQMSSDVLSANSLGEVITSMRKYSSGRYLSQFDLVLDPMNYATDEQKAALLSMYKINIISESEVAESKESINSEQAVLDITTKNNRKGSINFIFENNIWKIDNEAWQDGKNLQALVASIMASSTQATTSDNSVSATSTPNDSSASSTITRVIMPGLDSDSDGLTDKEETAIKTDLIKADTDGDGYSDGNELNNLYSPLGPGKLFDNKTFLFYDNKTYKYEAHYPAEWKLTNVDGDNSVMIDLPDEEFFQIVVQPNKNKQAITDWYREEFNIPVINQANVISGSGWQGVKSDDGLNVYLTNEATDNIFVISYNIGTKNVAEYINFFNLFVNNFIFVK